MSIEDLPTVKEALLGSEDKYFSIIDSILEHREYCEYEQLPQKFREWCKHLGCTQSDTPCNNIPTRALTLTTTFTPALLTSDLINTTTATQLHILGNTTILKSVKNIGCYDDYFCPPWESSQLLNIIFGNIGLVVCILGVLANALCLPAFSFGGRLSGTEVYLLGLLIWDLIYLVFTILLNLVPYVASTAAYQIEFYAKYSVHLVPWLFPILRLSELMSTWLIVGLLYDRFMYTRSGLQAKLQFSRRRVVIMKSIIAFLMTIYVIPHLFEFALVCNNDDNYNTDDLIVSTNKSNYKHKVGLKALRSTVGQNAFFLDLMYVHLRLPIDYLIPIVGCISFSYLIILRLPGLKKSQHRHNNVGYDPQAYGLRCAWEKPSDKVAIAIHKRNIVCQRERRFIKLSLVLAASALITRATSLIHTVIRLQLGVIMIWVPDDMRHKYLWPLAITSHVLDFLMPSCRPVAYAFTCHEYIRNLRNVLCCKPIKNEVFYSTHFQEAQMDQIEELPERKILITEPAPI